MKYLFPNFYAMIVSQAKQHGGKTALFVGDEQLHFDAIITRINVL